MVVHDELADITQWTQSQLRSDVIETWPAVHRNDCRAVPHCSAAVISDESEPVDVDEQPDSFPNVHTHRPRLDALG